MCSQETTTPSALAVARALVELADREGRHNEQEMTNLQLQKLLYNVQGMSLARRGIPAFTERIEAWKHGPVVRDLYHEIRGRIVDGSSPITPQVLAKAPELNGELFSFVASVWEDCKSSFYADTLVEESHQEAAYLAAYQPHDDDGRCENEITLEAMAEGFASRAIEPYRIKRRRPAKAEWLDDPLPFSVA